MSGYEEYLNSYLKDVNELALLLDYDGTLTPIVAHPDLAKIPSETKTVLERLACNPKIFVAIISGRKAENVKDLVGLQNIVYAGNHGLEVIYPDGSKYIHQLPTDNNDKLNQLIKQLEEKVVSNGAWIENKGASLTFHFRAVPEDLHAEFEQKAQKIIEDANFKAVKSHCGVEARPKVDWNKGSVALLLLNKKYGDNKWQNNVKIVFAGDDTTDEDAMKALKGYAATIRISSNKDVTTFADKVVSSTEDMLKILKLIKV